ncbi:MAG: DUF1573 domain-containing protein [Isosphaeraceae bacterium]|nr:DUF1573 domain-containing protein [Isosphaeraceae bacterium]
MRRLLATSVVLGAIFVGLSPLTSRAADWADALFAEHQHDFGTVPRGAKVHHTFVLHNRTQEPLTVLNVRASCGCTSGQASATLLQPGQAANVVAEMDTRNFVGRKETTLYVALMTASGREGEARLGVASTILSDVVLNPGSIDFGTVTRGQSANRTLAIDRIGAPNWRVVRMVSACRVINANLVETARNEGEVSYTLYVSLKPDAPAGIVREEIRILTNDPETPSIPVPITATIRGDLSASPNPLVLGRVTSPSGVQGRVVVRASKPFVIQSIEGAGDGFAVNEADGARKTLHVITITYKPEEGTLRGDLQKTFRVVTDLPGEGPVPLTALLHVDP